MAKISKLTPILYEKNETDFNHNGLGRLKEVVSYRIEEVLNGEFEAFFEYPASGQLADKIDNQMIIKARPNRKDDPTLFRIYEYDLDIMTGNYVIYARHKNMDDLGSNMVLDVAIRGQTPNEAWNLAQSKALDSVHTKFYSDMTTTSSTDWTRRSLLSTIAGEEGSMIQYWGGEIKHGTDWIWLYRRRGQDNVTTVRHGKNLDGLNATYSTKGLVTVVVPYHTYRVEESDNEKTIYGDVVESQYINHYPHKYYDTVEYSEDDLGLEQEATESERIEALNKVAERWFTENTGVDLPSINMEIDLVDLSQTKEYEKFKDFEQIEIGDTVTVYSKKYNINVNAKVRRVVYNGLTDINEEVEVGTVSRSIYDDYRDFVDNRVQEVREQVDAVRASANGKNLNLYGTVDPNEADVRGQDGDNYFRQNGQEDEIWIFRDGMWHKVMDSADTTKNSRAIEEQQKEIESAQARADEVVEEIDTAVESAGFTSLDETISSVQAIGNSAQARADEAVNEIITAVTNAGFTSLDETISTVQTIASGAESNAYQAIDNAQIADNKAQSALDEARSRLAITDFNTFYHSEYEATNERVLNTFTKNETNQLVEGKADRSELSNYVSQSRYERDADQMMSRFSTIEATYTTRDTVDAIVTDRVVDLMDGEFNLDGYATITYTDNKVTETAEAITRELSRVEETIPSLEGYARTEYVNNKTVETAEGVSRDLTQLINNKVDDEKFSQFYQNEYLETAQEVSRKISLSDIKIGGRNHFSQSNYSHHSNAGYSENMWTSAVVKIEPNTTYNISYVVTDSVRFGVAQVDLEDGLYSPYIMRELLIPYYQTNTGDSIDETFTTSDEGGFIVIYLHNDDPNVKEPYLMVEKGNTATDWTPAPEDMATQSQVSTLSNTVDGLNSTIARYEVELDEYGNVVSQYATQVSEFENTLDGLSNTVAEYAVEVDEYGNVVEHYATQVSDFRNTVDGLNSTVTAFEQEVSGYNAQVASLENTVNGFKSTVQRVEADYAGLSGTVNAHTTQISNMDGRISAKAEQSTVDTLAGSVNSLGTDIGVVAGQINQRVWNTDIETAIDGIEVGGRNLISDTEGPFELIKTSSTSYYDAIVRKTNVVPTGKEYILSFKAKASSPMTLRSHFYNPNTTTRTETSTGFVGSKIDGTADTEIGTEWDSYWIKWTQNETSDPKNVIVARIMNEFSNIVLEMKDIKFEKGNTVTDWTPAPEDTLARFDHIETEWTQTFDTFSQTVAGIDGRVTQQRQDIDGLTTTVQSVRTDLTGTTTLLNQTVSTVDTHTQNIATLRTDVNGKATVAQFNTLTSTVNGTITRVGNAEGKITQIETNVNGLQTNVASKASQSQVTQLATGLSSVVTDLESLGGTNLLEGSNGAVQSNIDYWSVSGDADFSRNFHSFFKNREESVFVLRTTGTREVTATNNTRVYVEPNTTYTFSMVGFMNVDVTSVDVHFLMRRKGETSNYTITNTVLSGIRLSPSRLDSVTWTFTTPNISDLESGIIRIDNNGINSEGSSAAVYFTNVKLEKGTVATDYSETFTEKASQSQITQLQDNINLRVEKGDVINQINISNENILIQSENILLDGDVTVRGTAWMDGAVLKNLSVDGAKIQDATISSAKIANLDVNKISGNLTNFVQSNWNSAIGGSVQATGNGLISTAPDSSQVVIAGGHLLARQPNGATIGSVGYVNDGTKSPNFTIETSWGTHFNIKQNFLDTWTGYTQEKDVLRVSTYDDGDSEVLWRTNRFQLLGGASLGFAWRHYINGASQRLNITGEESIGLRANESTIFAVSNNGNTNHASLFANLNMNGSNVTNQSDARLKTDISTRQESSLEKINRFNFVDFRWLKDGRSDFGVIAQQVQQVAPELILEGSDGYLNLNNSLMNMMTSHGLQELSQKHDTVAQTVDSHTDTIHRLQQELSQANRRIEELERKIS